jgi:probable HAF family extracellular repeat protein
LLPAGLTAVAINASDQVAETTSSTGTPVAGIWTNGVLSATVSGADAVALNNQGHLLVDTYPNSTQNLSTRTELVRNGSSITLPLLPGCSTSTGVAVNSADQAIGTCLSTASDGTAVTHGVVWTVAANGTATATDVGSLGGAYVDPLAIDAAGDVMGNASNSIATPHSHAFLWNAGHLTDLGSLGGTDTWATAMNASGEIVGESTTSYDTSNAHAFVWAAGTMTDLTPTANTASTAGGINDTGEVVESTVPTRPGSAAGNFAAGTYVSVLWQLH